MTRPLYRHTNLQVIFLITLMAVMGTSSITPAFPQMITALGLTSQSIGLLITFFTLPGAILTPFLGILADRHGRKRILVPALLLFAIAGSACALTKNVPILLSLRFLQGIGAAGLGALNITLIGDLYSGPDRTAAMGYNAGVLSLGIASYPLIGGALAMMSWNAPFLLSALALPVALFALFFLESPHRPKKEEHLGDYLHGVWKCILQRRMIGLFLCSILSFVILFGAYLTYFPLLLDQYGASPFFIGLMMTSMSIGTALTAVQLRRLRRVYSEKTLMKAACFCYALSLFMFPLVESLWRFLLPCFFFGVAQGLNMPNIQSLIAELAPMSHRGAFMSVNGMVLRVGQTLGPLIAAGLYGVGGMGAVFFSAAIFSLLMWGVIRCLVD